MVEDEPMHRQRTGPILWRERYIILASIVVLLALAIAYTVTSPKVYEATAILQVNLATNNPGSSDTTNANQGLAQNYATLLVSPGFLGEVRRRIPGRPTVDSLQGKLTATALTQSALVQLKATGSTPKEAQTLASDVINGFLANLQSNATTRTTQLAPLLQQQITTISGQIATLQARVPTPAITQQISSLKASQTALINQYATLVTNGIQQGTSATLSAAPVASSSPISPKKSLNLIAGLLLGVLL